MSELMHELRTEQLLFWRSRELAFFTFLLPIIFFVLLGSVYGTDRIDHVKARATCSPECSDTAWWRPPSRAWRSRSSSGASPAC